MKLKSLNKYISLLILVISFLPVKAENEIDIWNKEKKIKSEINAVEKNSPNTTVNTKVFSTNNINNNIKVENKILDDSQKIKIFGIYDPAENDFNLNMWSSTKAEDIRSSIKRINKIKL